MEARVRIPARAYSEYVDLFLKLSDIPTFEPVQHAFNYVISWSSDAPYNIISSRIFKILPHKQQLSKIGWKRKTISDGQVIEINNHKLIYQYQYTRSNPEIMKLLSMKQKRKVQIPDRIFLSFYSDFYTTYSYQLELILGKNKTTAIIKPKKGLKHNAQASVNDALTFLKSFNISLENATQEFKSTEAYIRFLRAHQWNVVNQIDQLTYFFNENNITKQTYSGLKMLRFIPGKNKKIAEVYQWFLEFEDFNAYIKLYYPKNPLAIPKNDISYHPKLEVKLSKSEKFKDIKTLNALAKGLLLFLMIQTKIKPSYIVRDEITKHDYFTSTTQYEALLLKSGVLS